MTTSLGHRNVTRKSKVYADVYQNIRKDVVEATKELIKAGIWKADVSNEDKAIFMGVWVQKVSAIYGMEPPKVYFIGGADGNRQYNRTGGGCYFPSTHEMYIFKKPSLTTLLHEFRHAMQNKLNVKEYKDDCEHDARAWSCSLYRLSAPKAYKRAVEKGILHFK